MKTLNLLKYSASVLAFSVMATLAACGSKNSDQPAPTNNNLGFQQCLNCQNLFQGYSEYSSNPYAQTGAGLTLNWTFQSQGGLGQSYQQAQPYQQSQPQQYNPYDPYANSNPYGGGYSQTTYSGVSPIISYNGPVSASGFLNVTTPLIIGYCQIPVGSYQLGTVAQGQWYSATISNLRMHAVGPVTLFITLTSGRVSSPKPSGQSGVLWSEVAPVGRINGDLMIESVNGSACAQSIFVN